MIINKSTNITILGLENLKFAVGKMSTLFLIFAAVKNPAKFHKNDKPTHISYMSRNPEKWKIVKLAKSANCAKPHPYPDALQNFSANRGNCNDFGVQIHNVSEILRNASPQANFQNCQLRR